jgi:hypothetical protein
MMTMFRRQPLCIALGLTLMFTSTAARAQTTSPSYPESNAGLEQMVKDILLAASQRDERKVLALTTSMELPKPKEWFEDVFGKDIGAKLATEHDTELNNLGIAFARLFLQIREPQKMTVEITRVETPEDPNAKPYQVLALAEMRNPVPLYTITMRQPGQPGSITIWSVVYVKGTFRAAGKMAAIHAATSRSAR